MKVINHFVRIRMENMDTGAQGVAQATGTDEDDALCNAAMQFVNAAGGGDWEVVEILDSVKGLHAAVRGHGVRGAGR